MAHVAPSRTDLEIRRAARIEALADRINAAAALSRKDAALYVGLSEGQLRNPRFRGPRYRRAGRRIVYLRSDLDAWLESLPSDTAPEEGSR